MFFQANICNCVQWKKLRRSILMSIVHRSFTYEFISYTLKKHMQFTVWFKAQRLPLPVMLQELIFCTNFQFADKSKINATGAFKTECIKKVCLHVCVCVCVYGGGGGGGGGMSL